jgi:hypothetical protein
MRFPGNAPELSEERSRFYSAQGSENEMSRRKFLFLSTLAAFAVAAGIDHDVVSPVAEQVTKRIWPNRDASVGVVDSKRLGVYSNRMIFSIPGFGQMDSYNAAHQQDAAFKSTENLAYIYLPTYMFDEHDIAEALWESIQRYKVTEVVLEGISMGMTTGYMGYRAIQNRINNLVQKDLIPSRTTLPRLRGAFGNCSPPSFNDALTSPPIQWLSDQLDNSDFVPDIRHKYLYDYGDGDGDLVRGTNITNLLSFMQHLVETGQQTLNNTSPETAYSQGKLLSRFNWLQQSVNYMPILDPEMDAVQVEPIAYDDIVNQKAAPHDWETGYARANVKRFQLMKYKNPLSGHADTIEFANVMADAKFRGAVLRG